MPEKTFIIQIVQVAATVALVGFVLSRLRLSSATPAERVGNKRILKPPTSMWVISYGGMVFWLALIAISGAMPGKTPPSQMPWIHAIFALFALLSAILAYLCHVGEVAWDEDGITGPNWYGKRIHLRWSDQVECGYSAGMQSLKLSSPGKESIVISEYWTGLADLLTFLGRQEGATVNLPDDEED